MSKVSFRPVSSPTIDVEVTKVTSEATPAIGVSAALAPRPANEVSVTRSSTFGGEDDADAGDIRYPRLNLSQKSSAVQLIKIGIGQFILNKELGLGESLRAIVVGFGPKRYIEKTKYVAGANSNAKFANSLQEVDALNGTTSWRESKENSTSGSDRAWYQPSITALLLIEKPAGVADDRFTFEADGKAYAAALFSVKSTAYDSFYVKLNSEQKTGLLREGFPTRFISLSSVLVPFKGGEAFQPQVKVLEKVSDETLKLARSLRG